MKEGHIMYLFSILMAELAPRKNYEVFKKVSTAQKIFEADVVANLPPFTKEEEVEATSNDPRISAKALKSYHKRTGTDLVWVSKKIRAYRRK